MVLVKMGNEIAKKVKPLVENSGINTKTETGFREDAKRKREQTRQDRKDNKRFQVNHANTISRGKYWRDPVKLKL